MTKLNFDIFEFFSSASFKDYMQRRIRSSFKNFDSKQIEITLFPQDDELYVKREGKTLNRIVLGLGAFDLKSIMRPGDDFKVTMDQWQLNFRKFITRLFFGLFHEASHIAYTPLPDEIRAMVMMKRRGVIKARENVLKTSMFLSLHNIIEDEFINRTLRNTYPGSIRSGYKLLTDFLIKEPKTEELKEQSYSEKFLAALIFNFLYGKNLKLEEFIENEEFLRLTKESLRELEGLKQYDFSEEGQEARVLMAYDLFMKLFDFFKSKETSMEISSQSLALDLDKALDGIEVPEEYVLQPKDIEAFDASSEKKKSSSEMEEIQKGISIKSQAEMLDYEWDSLYDMLSKNMATNSEIDLDSEELEKLDPTIRELLETYIYVEKGNFRLSADQRGKALASKIKEIILESNGGIHDRQERGRLSRKQLHKVAFTSNVFYRRSSEKRLKDICITALLDLSGSMNCSQEELEDAATILSRVGMDLKIPLRISGYNNYLQPLKDYGTISQAEHKGLASKILATGGTNLPHALKKALNTSSRKNKDELYIIVCDGDIGDEYLKEVIQKAGPKKDFALIYYSDIPSSSSRRRIDGTLERYVDVVGPKMAHIANKEQAGDLERVILQIVKEHIFI